MRRIGSALTLLLITLIVTTSVFAQRVNFASLPQSRGMDGAFTLGNANVTTTLVVFADFLCPECQTYQTTLNQFINQHVASGKSKLEYRMVRVIDPAYSLLAAQLTECAGTLRPNKFWTSYEVMYRIATRDGLDTSTALNFATDTGYEYPELLICQVNARQSNIDTELADDLDITEYPYVMLRNGAPDDLTAYQHIGASPDLATLENVVINGVLPQQPQIVVTPKPVVEDFVIGITTLDSSQVTQFDDTSLLTDSPCAVPCWRNINPGVTQVDKAFRALSKEGIFTNMAIKQHSESGGQVMPIQLQGGGECCRIYIAQSTRIRAVEVHIKPQVTLGQVIAKHGNPAYIAVEPLAPDRTRLSFFYPEPQQLIVQVYTSGIDTGSFTADSIIATVVYLSDLGRDNVLAGTNMYNYPGYSALSAFVDGNYDVLAQ